MTLSTLTCFHALCSRAAAQAGALEALAALLPSAGCQLALACLRTLWHVLHTEAEAIARLAAQLAAAGALHMAVQHLSSEDAQLQDAALCVLWSLAEHTACHGVLLAQQVVPPLLQLLSPATDATVCTSASSTVAC